jgi:hypothetical protein
MPRPSELLQLAQFSMCNAACEPQAVTHSPQPLHLSASMNSPNAPPVSPRLTERSWYLFVRHTRIRYRHVVPDSRILSSYHQAAPLTPFQVHTPGRFGELASIENKGSSRCPMGRDPTWVRYSTQA